MELKIVLVLLIFTGTAYCQGGAGIGAVAGTGSTGITDASKNAGTSEICDVTSINQCLGVMLGQVSGPAGRNIWKVVGNPKEELQIFCSGIQAIERCAGDNLFENCDENTYAMQVKNTVEGYEDLCSPENLEKILDANWCLETSKSAADSCIQKYLNLAATAENDWTKCREISRGLDCVTNVIYESCPKDVEELVQDVQQMISDTGLEDINCDSRYLLKNQAANVSFSFLALALCAIILAF